MSLTSKPEGDCPPSTINAPAQFRVVVLVMFGDPVYGVEALPTLTACAIFSTQISVPTGLPGVKGEDPEVKVSEVAPLYILT